MDPNQAAVLALTVIQIPSVICAIYIFVQLFQRTSSLRRLQNHLFIYLLIVATWNIIIDLPNSQVYFWTGTVSISTPWFCRFWNMSYLYSAALNRFLMAFMAIERHFLVFRPHFYHTHRSRVLFHYTPLVFMFSLIFIYLLIANVFVSCPGSAFIYYIFMCGYTCAVRSTDLGTIYCWVFVFIPTTMTIIGCVLLPVRFIIQKRTLQRIQWHRARKMIVQMSIIAGTYSICWLPYTIVLQLDIAGIVPFFDPNMGRFLALMPYITSLLTPFIILHTMHDETNLALVERIKHRFFPRRQQKIRPVVNSVEKQQDSANREKHTATNRNKIGES
ncbi:unnamed protein product [Adineta steineri]|uniref:G-protein coupled receptors family 1 profile domain-containing protein n=1 Tax=Adineta steineri TaxID=433720 RepID=A0A818NSE8_9BILA|nr:unnamed protein product [Adineta steineri]CAF3609719.1 unnamed protein product [Adineta steineri]